MTSINDDRERRAKFAADAARMTDDELRQQMEWSKNHPGELLILQSEWDKRLAPVSPIEVAAKRAFELFEKWDSEGAVNPTAWDALDRDGQLAWRRIAASAVTAYMSEVIVQARQEPNGDTTARI